MRVIAGSVKGHRLRSPTTGTRPMMDRMKESVFSALGDVDGALVLDLYAGSGSLGIEALSRGAERAVFVENAREAIVKLEQNLEATELVDRSEVVWGDVKAHLRNHPDDRFDLVFLDPPYNMAHPAVRADLESLVMFGYLSDEGKILVHRSAKENPLKPLGLKSVWERDFGQSRLVVFMHEDEEEGA
jgi:16S rRNA (guanine966-N2)-methyltransferase